VFFISPGVISDIDYVEGTHSPTLDFGWIDKKLCDVQNEFKDSKERGNVLLVMDDVVGELKRE